jgi:hypothetical protein
MKKEIYTWCVENNITRDWFLNTYTPEPINLIDEYCEMMNISDFTKGFVMSLFDLYEDVSIKGNTHGDDTQIKADRFIILDIYIPNTYLNSSQYLHRLKTLINDVKNDKY